MSPKITGVTCIRHGRAVILEGHDRIKHKTDKGLCDSEQFRVTEEVSRGFALATLFALPVRQGHVKA